MKRMEYWIEFFAPGSFVAETWTQKVGSLPSPESVDFGDNAYSCKFWQREDIIEGDKTFKGDAEQVGPLYYHPHSLVQSLDEAAQNPRATDILLSNMRCNQWEHIVWSRWGNWPQPFDAAKMQVIGRSLSAQTDAH